MDDTILDDIDDSDVEASIDSNKAMPINVINTNARSLCPKIDSLIDCFEEMDATVGIVTETWRADGESLDKDVHDLAKGAGLNMICLNDRSTVGEWHMGEWQLSPIRRPAP